MCSVWPTSNASANCRHLGGGEPIGGANSALPTPAATINHLGTALDNLVLAAANDTTFLQQLRASNLVLATSNAMLTTANKKLSEALVKVKVVLPPATSPGTPGAPCSGNAPFLGNYFWTHGHRCSQHHLIHTALIYSALGSW